MTYFSGEVYFLTVIIFLVVASKSACCPKLKIIPLLDNAVIVKDSSSGIQSHLNLALGIFQKPRPEFVPQCEKSTSGPRAGSVSALTSIKGEKKNSATSRKQTMCVFQRIWTVQLRFVAQLTIETSSTRL